MSYIVRIWRVPVSFLDRQHLLGEHAELHCIFNVITKGLKGFRNHPQVNRFRDHLGMLVDRHAQQVREMERRGWNHKSPLPQVDCQPEEYSYSDKDHQEDLALLKEREGKNLDFYRELNRLMGR